MPLELRRYSDQSRDGKITFCMKQCLSLNVCLFFKIQTINTVLWLFNMSCQITVAPQFKRQINQTSFHIYRYLKHEINMNGHGLLYTLLSGLFVRQNDRLSIMIGQIVCQSNSLRTVSRAAL